MNKNRVHHVLNGGQNVDKTTFFCFKNARKALFYAGQKDNSFHMRCLSEPLYVPSFYIT